MSETTLASYNGFGKRLLSLRWFHKRDFTIILALSFFWETWSWSPCSIHNLRTVLVAFLLPQLWYVEVNYETTRFTPYSKKWSAMIKGIFPSEDLIKPRHFLVQQACLRKRTSSACFCASRPNMIAPRLETWWMPPARPCAPPPSRGQQQQKIMKPMIMC